MVSHASASFQHRQKTKHSFPQAQQAQQLNDPTLENRLNSLQIYERRDYMGRPLRASSMGDYMVQASSQQSQEPKHSFQQAQRAQQAQQLSDPAS